MARANENKNEHKESEKEATQDLLAFQFHLCR